MKLQKVIDILKTEKKCVERAGTSTMNRGCDRNCADCDLVLDDKEILTAYKIAIQHMEQINRTLFGKGQKYTKEQHEYCGDCNHAEMCSWYGAIGCEWRDVK